MQIKTITCHNVYNYGASLQAYALQHFLEGLGNQVQIIDFQPWYHQNVYNLGYFHPKSHFYWISIHFKSIAKIIGFFFNRRMLRTWGRKKRFDDFTKNYLNLTTQRYSNIDELKKNPPEADIYVAGSDQIWNPESMNGFEPAYYLDFGSTETKKVSYAASFAVNELTAKSKSFVKDKIGKFDKISIRESSGVELVKQLGITNVELALDPVFLLDKEEWTEMFHNIDFKIGISDFILLYDFIGDARISDFALKCREETGLKIVAVCDLKLSSIADKNIKNAGPLEFLYLIYKARFVISNSFHATAFSYILERNFYSFPLLGQNNSSRIEDFLKMVGMEERYNPDNILHDSFTAAVTIKNVIESSRNFLKQIVS